VCSVSEYFKMLTSSRLSTQRTHPKESALRVREKEIMLDDEREREREREREIERERRDECVYRELQRRNMEREGG